MGRKKLSRPDIDSLFSDISRMLVPEHILQDFDIYGAREYPEYWMIELREKEGRIPGSLHGFADIVLMATAIRCRCSVTVLYANRFT